MEIGFQAGAILSGRGRKITSGTGSAQEEVRLRLISAP